MKIPFQRFRKTGKTLSHEIRTQTITLILAAFGFVAGLAWNEAIRAAIDHFFPVDASESLWAKFIYAVFVTVLLVVGGFYLNHLKREGPTSKR